RPAKVAVTLQTASLRDAHHPPPLHSFPTRRSSDLSKFAPIDNITAGRYPKKHVSNIINGICHKYVRNKSIHPIIPFTGETDIWVIVPTPTLIPHKNKLDTNSNNVTAAIFQSHILANDTGRHMIFCIPVFLSRIMTLADSTDTSSGSIKVYHQLYVESCT